MPVSAMRACAVNSEGAGNVRPSPSSDAIVSDFCTSAITTPVLEPDEQAGSLYSGPSTAEHEHAVGAEAVRVGEGGAFRHAAAVADGLEVADVGAGVPLGACVRDEVVDAELSHPVGLGELALEAEPGARGCVHEVLVRDVDGEVLVSGRVERRPATSVLPVGAQPSSVAAVDQFARSR